VSTLIQKTLAGDKVKIDTPPNRGRKHLRV